MSPIALFLFLVCDIHLTTDHYCSSCSIIVSPLVCPICSLLLMILTSMITDSEAKPAEADMGGEMCECISDLVNWHFYKVSLPRLESVLSHYPCMQIFKFYTTPPQLFWLVLNIWNFQQNMFQKGWTNEICECIKTKTSYTFHSSITEFLQSEWAVTDSSMNFFKSNVRI